jgi:hypothetical protein
MVLRPPPLPVLGALAASVLLGVVLTSQCWLLDGGVGVPRTLFSDGHVVGTQLGGDMLLSGDLAKLWTVRAAWPGGARLRPLLWPVAVGGLTVGPAVALTLAWALVPALGVLGGAALARVCGAGPWGAALSGALLAWAPWVRVTLANGQVEQAGLGAVALAWAAAVFAEEGGWGRVVWAPAVLLGVGLAAPNLALTGGVGLGLLALARALGDRTRWTRHAVVVVLGLAACAASASYHRAGFTEGPDVFRPRERAPAEVSRKRAYAGPIAGWHAVDTAQLEDATPTALLVPPGPLAFERPAQHAPFLGYIVLLGAILGAIRRPRAALPWVGVGLAFCVLSLGARLQLSATHFLPLPWLLVERAVPAVAQSGTPYRMAMGAIVSFAVAAGVGLVGSGRAVPGVALALATLAWLETTLLPGHPLPFPAQVAGGHVALDQLDGDGGPVLDLPLPIIGRCEAQPAHYLAGVARHRRPYLHTADAGRDLRSYASNRERMVALDRSLARSDCPETLPARLAALEVSAVIGHLDETCALSSRDRGCLEAALGPPDVVADDVLIWRLP